MKYHEAANLFPLLEGDEFEQLVADIKAHGQQEPITVHRGAILDGRNRHRACQRLGLEPRFAYRDDIADPVLFVVSLNIHRRHLTPAQRAAIAAEAMGLYRAQAKEAQREGLATGWEISHGAGSRQLAGTSKPNTGTRGDAAERAAKAFNVGEGTVIRAEQVMKAAPELHERVKAGEMTGYAAYNETKERRQRAKRDGGAGAPAADRREEERQRREAEMAATVRRVSTAPARLARHGETDAVVGVFADIRRVVLATNAHEIAEGMTGREEQRVRAAFRDLEEWFSKLDCALCDARTREELRARAAGTAGRA